MFIFCCRIKKSLSSFFSSSCLYSPPPFSCSLALFLVFVAAVLVLSLATGNIQIHSPDRQFLPIYLLKKNQAPRRYSTSLLVQNSSGESTGDFPEEKVLLCDLGGNMPVAEILHQDVLNFNRPP